MGVLASMADRVGLLFVLNCSNKLKGDEVVDEDVDKLTGECCPLTLKVSSG